MDQYPILVKPTPSSPVSNPHLILQRVRQLPSNPHLILPRVRDTPSKIPVFLKNKLIDGIYWVLLKPKY